MLANLVATERRWYDWSHFGKLTWNTLVQKCFRQSCDVTRENFTQFDFTTASWCECSALKILVVDGCFCRWNRYISILSTVPRREGAEVTDSVMSGAKTIGQELRLNVQSLVRALLFLMVEIDEQMK